MVRVCGAHVYGRGRVVGNNVSWSLVYDSLILTAYDYNTYTTTALLCSISHYRLDVAVILFITLQIYNYYLQLVYSCKVYTRLNLMLSLTTNYPFTDLNKL